MKLATYSHEGEIGYGEVAGDAILPIGGQAGMPADLRGFLALGLPSPRPSPRRGPPVALDAVRLLPPVPNAGKILCVATNFHEPSGAGKPVPEHPLVFTRFSDSLVGHGEALLKPRESERFDFEGELAVVIGRGGHRIARADAMAHVAGYACFNDGSARDWQKHSTQFTPGKNFYRSGAFGPFLVGASAIANPSALALETRVNGVAKQAIGLDRFIFDIPWLIAYLSTFTPLAPGDVIATGTPSGFGSTRQPPEFLSHGDVVEVEITGVGCLRNPVSEADRISK